MKVKTILLAVLGVFASLFLVSADEPAPAAAVPEATTYQFRNLKFDGLLRPQDANSANGTRIVLYSAQPWKCMTWRLQPAGESTFRVQNLFTAKTFAADAGTDSVQPSVVQVPMKKDAPETPAWSFTRLEDGNYKIADAKSGKVLTVIKGEGGQIKIAAEPWQGHDEQKWKLQKIDPKQLTM